MFLNPLNWGKKREPTEEEIAAAVAKREAEEEAAARAKTVAKHAEGDKAAGDLERQLRGLTKRIDETLRKLDLLEKRRDEEMSLMVKADKAGSDARKKMHWRNKKRAEDEIKSMTAHMSQLEDMKATCEKRISQLHRQQDLELATEALGKTKVDVEEVENVMEEAKMGVENVADVESVMNSYQLSDEVYDDDEMAKELAEFEQKQKEKEEAQAKLKPAEVAAMTEPQVPDVMPASQAAETEEEAVKRLEREMAQ